MLWRGHDPYRRREGGCGCAGFLLALGLALIGIGYGLVQVRLGNLPQPFTPNRTSTPRPTPTPTLSVESFVRLAEEAEAKGDFRTAIEYFDRASRRQTNDPALHVRAARLMVFINQPQRAEQRARRALEIAPEHLPAKAVLCMALDWQKRVAEALELCQAVVNADPNYATGHAYLAEALADAGNFAAARQAAQRALELEPTNVDALRNMGYVHEVFGRYDTALYYYQRALEMQPNLPHVLNAMGRLYFVTGRSRSAVSALRRAIEIDAQNAEAYYRLGVIYQTLGEFGQARVALDKAIELDPLQVRALTQRGSLNFQTRNYFGSVEDYTRAISVSQALGVSLTPVDYINLGFAYRWIQQCDKAIEAWNTASAMAPTDETVQSYVRSGYRQCGR
ncbi:MAG: tetratricopeptide repeat protein [Anaerolineae bacterium]|nr:tetratricopeptide repeat protein [Anaerolineae bacterium]